MRPSAILRKFAKARERAYGITKTMDGRKARSITNILSKADMVMAKSEQVQLRAVVQLESDIMVLLPSEQSRFVKVRADMLELLHKAKLSTHVPNTYPADHEGSPETQVRNQKTVSGIPDSQRRQAAPLQTDLFDFPRTVCSRR